MVLGQVGEIWQSLVPFSIRGYMHMATLLSHSVNRKQLQLNQPKKGQRWAGH